MVFAALRFSHVGLGTALLSSETMHHIDQSVCRTGTIAVVVVTALPAGTMHR